MKIIISKSQWEEMGKKAGWEKTAAKVDSNISIQLQGVDEYSGKIAIMITNAGGNYPLFISQEASPEAIGDVVKQMMKEYQKQEGYSYKINSGDEELGQ